MNEGYPPAYDPDAYEPIFGRADGASERLVRIGVRRRPQEDIDKRRARRERREANVGESQT